jgi:hypothetical protein
VICELYSALTRQRSSSCALAPPRKPPPGFFAEAKFSANASVSRSSTSSLRSAAPVVSPVTSTRVARGSVNGSERRDERRERGGRVEHGAVEHRADLGGHRDDAARRSGVASAVGDRDRLGGEAFEGHSEMFVAYCN